MICTKSDSARYRTALSTSDNSSGANDARAAVINVLTGGADPTGDAVLWDGLDFLDRGLNHRKFKEYTKVTIGLEILNEFTEYGSSQRNRDKVNKNFVVQCVFCEQSGSDFSKPGNSKMYYSLKATGTKGGSIFWKLGKK
jgi:hypothetical protein